MDTAKIKVLGKDLGGLGGGEEHVQNIFKLKMISNNKYIIKRMF